MELTNYLSLAEEDYSHNIMIIQSRISGESFQSISEKLGVTRQAIQLREVKILSSFLRFYERCYLSS